VEQFDQVQASNPVLLSSQINTAQLHTIQDAVLHSIDSVFGPNDDMDDKRADPMFLKNLDNGDAS
jgi:hypothetical protein